MKNIERYKEEIESKLKDESLACAIAIVRNNQTYKDCDSCESCRLEGFRWLLEENGKSIKNKKRNKNYKLRFKDIFKLR